MERKYLIEYKELMDEWDYIKNDILHFDPTNITYGSGIKVNWICSECGHNWQAVVRNRIRGQGCPKCAIKKISVKKTIPKGDKLSITHPELSKEWFYERNTEYDFYNIATFSNQKVWWKCKNGHVWDEIISNRTRRNSGCPYCSNHRILKGYNDLSTTAPHLAVQWNYERNKDIDIYSISSYSNRKVWWKCKNNHEWQSSPSHRMRGSGCPECKNKKQVSIPEKTIVYYLRQFFIVEEQKKFIWLGRKDIDIFLPELNLAIEYDGEVWHKNTIRDLEKEILLLNHGLSLIRIREPNCPKYEGNCKCIITDNPKNKFFLRNALNKLMLYINKKYDLNHSFCYDYENDYLKIYELVVTERENNNLQLLFPTVANEWNFARNGNLRPTMFAPGSNAIVWWKCEKGHEWKTSIVDRTLGEYGCPFCSNQRLLKGYNDLETTYPLLVKEWNFEKNLNLKPCDLTFGTAKIVWWKCEKGHEWKASVVSRTKVGNKCPICSNRMVLKGYNDLESQYPNLIKEWDYDKNIVDPCEISYHYDNKVY